MDEVFFVRRRRREGRFLRIRIREIRAAGISGRVDGAIEGQNRIGTLCERMGTRRIEREEELPMCSLEGFRLS